MTNFIPIFPLALVVFPNEKVNLHIFEERYKQLINDCAENGKPFCVLPVIGEKITEFGTSVQVAEIRKRYPDGKMDITIEGQRICKVLEIIKSVPDKLYSGAIAHFSHNSLKPATQATRPVLNYVKDLLNLLSIHKPEEPSILSTSYQLARLCGLNLQQEYELLQLLNESHRMEYLRRHLASVLPVIREMESLKTRIQMNGHFRSLKSWGID